jgi:hypothetical protein
MSQPERLCLQGGISPRGRATQKEADLERSDVALSCTWDQLGRAGARR